ncbi:MAG TPA: methyltransferase domain-containing protein [Chthoniobacterales bacterium]|nr:methyltransferase domain-containing protein [Chthoniobacterales bacterium]
MELLDIPRDQFREIAEAAFSEKNAVLNARDYESNLKKLFRRYADPNKLKLAIAQRSEIIFQEVEPLLVGSSLLDIGCGNGLIAQSARKHFQEILLVDVVNYLLPSIDLPFAKYDDGQPLPTERKFDTVLLLTVLHHSFDPLLLLRAAWRAVGKRLLIIESVFGASDDHLAEQYALAGHSEDTQLAYAVYVDWLYNRVLHDDIAVPYNFTRPDRWIQIFGQEGMSKPVCTNLGQDIPIAPELHFLFTFDKQS